MEWYIPTEKMKKEYLKSNYGRIPILWFTIFGIATIGCILQIIREGVTLWKIIGTVVVALIALYNAWMLFRQTKTQHTMRHYPDMVVFAIVPILSYSADVKKNAAGEIVSASNCKIRVNIDNREEEFTLKNKEYLDIIQYKNVLVMRNNSEYGIGILLSVRNLPAEGKGVQSVESIHNENRREGTSQSLEGMGFLFDPNSGLYYKNELVCEKATGRESQITIWVNPKTGCMYERYEDALACKNPISSRIT